MKLLIPIGEVPLGTKITKKSGEKVYEVSDKIRVYGGENCNHPELKVSPGTKLIISVDPRFSFYVEAVPDTLEVVWELSNDQLKRFLFEKESHR